MRRTVISEEFTDDIVRALGRGPRSSVLRQLRQLRGAAATGRLSRAADRVFSRVSHLASRISSISRENATQSYARFKLLSMYSLNFLDWNLTFLEWKVTPNIHENIAKVERNFTFQKSEIVQSSRLDLFFNFKKSGFSRREDVL